MRAPTPRPSPARCTASAGRWGSWYKELTPAELLTKIHDRNEERYGDPLGPSIEWLREQGRSWDDIIRSATTPGGADLGF